MNEVKNFKSGMEYRRFGKTDEMISSITLGGMRYIHGWDKPRSEIPEDTLEHCTKVVESAMNAGINHIETAWGYEKSETLYGKVLNEVLKIPRGDYLLMTKGNALGADEMRSMVETQLEDLQTDYFDFYAWHGINNQELLDHSCKPNGAIEELLKMKEEGMIKHVGFSTHAPLEIIIRTIETKLFEFVNLHYYYFDQRNLGAVQIAQANDLGVFIISPNDKGGQLFNAPEKVRKATGEATPIQWNARFCLQNPAVHTLSFGLTEEEHFDEMKGIFPVRIPWTEEDQKIKQNLDSFLLDDPYAYYDGFDLQNDPSDINIPAILRLRKLWKCYDMKDYGVYRYKVFKNKDHWFPGDFAFPSNIEKIDITRVPANIPLKELLHEAHEAFYTPPQYSMIRE